MPFISAIAGAIGTAIGLGTVGVALAQAAIGLGINYIVRKAEERRAKKAAASAAGTQFDREYGENVSRKVPCGRVGISGHDAYVNTYASANRELQQLYVFGDFPCDGLSKIWAGGTLLTLEFLAAESNSVVQRYRVSAGDYAGLMRFAFYTGTQAEADPELIAHANPTGRWTANHRGAGICYLVAYMSYDAERLSSFPDFFFEIRGARLYDPRKDSSIGGAGDHRWGDYSTYQFTENPIVMDYNYRRGFSWNGDLFLGMGMDPELLPVDRYVTAANICDEVEDGEARYRCCAILDANLEHGDNIDALMGSCAAMVIDSVDGSWPLIGTEQPIVATFTDDDLVPDEQLVFQRRRSQADLVNSVSGTYPEPANMWSAAGYDTQTDASYVGIDRRTRDFPLNFDCVPSKRQANQLAAIYFKENRFQATAQIVLPPRFRDINVGEWVRWNSARFGDRTYIVQSRSIRALDSDGPRNVSLSLQERDGSIYAKTGVQPAVVPIPNGEPVYLNALQDWRVIAVLAQAPDSRTIPAFRMSWSPIEDVTVTAIDFQWWLKDAPDNRFNRRIGADVTFALLQEGTISNAPYVFRHKLVADRPTNWSQEQEVRALDGGNADLDVSLSNLQRDVKDQFSRLFAEFDDLRPVLERLLTSEQLGGASTEIMRRRLSREIDNASAAFSEEISVVTGELAAAVSQVTALDAEFERNKASVQEDLAAVATDVSALAEAAQTLTASINDLSVQGKVRFGVAASQAGVDARFSVAIRANAAGAFKETGLYLELYTADGVQRSRFAVAADQFVVTNGVAGALPLVFENGELKLQVANIGTVRTGLLEANNGKLIINLNTGFIAIYD